MNLRSFWYTPYIDLSAGGGGVQKGDRKIFDIIFFFYLPRQSTQHGNESLKLTQYKLIILVQAFLFGGSAKAEIELLGVENRKTVEVNTEKGTQKLYLYVGNEPVKGKVHVKLTKEGKKVEHQGMRVDFIGHIGKPYPKY